MRPRVCRLSRTILQPVFRISTSLHEPFPTMFELQEEHSSKFFPYGCCWFDGKMLSSLPEKNDFLWCDYVPEWPRRVFDEENKMCIKNIKSNYEEKESQTHRLMSYEDTKSVLEDKEYHLIHRHTYKTESTWEDSRFKTMNIQESLAVMDENINSILVNDFICILLKCKTYKDLAFLKRVYVHIRECGLVTHRVIGNHLVPLFVECGSVTNARDIFNRLVYKNVYSCTCLMLGYIQCSEFSHAIEIYDQMQADGVSPNSYALVAVLKACTLLNDITRGHEVHTQIVFTGLERSMIVGSATINMYVKNSFLPEAQETFERLPVRNVVVWTTLMSGYAEHRQGPEALKCYEKMQLECILPNDVTFVCVLQACTCAGLMNKGQEIHIEIAQKGLECVLFIANTLIDMYAKGGSLLDARYIFDSLPVKDSTSWNVMIQGYNMNHDSESALALFEKMQLEGGCLDSVTFACVINACSRANLVVKGQAIYKSMIEVYKITPDVDHLTCMVDLLGRAGKFGEAVRLLESSHCLPSIDTWRALLTACKKYSEVEIGERCFYQLIEMNPECAAPYVLMADLYARVGRRADALRLETFRRLSGARKKAAVASIEVDNELHEFVVGSSKSKKIAEQLRSLASRTTLKGHFPYLDLVVKPVSDGEKVTLLCEHVEKLAIGFGLANTLPGTTIRVTKNMRMCNDCHNTSKIISRVERREIIVRDIYCVHRFKEGQCSCADACVL